MKYLVLLIFAGLSFGSLTSGIQCYECHFSEPHIPGVTEYTCEGPNPHVKHLTNCSANFNHCLTIVGWVTGTTTWSISRECVSDSQVEQCNSIPGGTVCYYVCDADGCNTSNGAENPDPANPQVPGTTAGSITRTILPSTTITVTTTSGSSKPNLNFVIMKLTLVAGFLFIKF